MSKRFGTIGHIGDSSLGLALAMSILAAKPRPPKPPTQAQIAERDKRTERQRWNDEVAERKAARKLTKDAQ